MSDPTRIGLLGAGAIAQQAHLPVLGKMRGVELVALCDNDGPRKRAHWRSDSVSTMSSRTSTTCWTPSKVWMPSWWRRRTIGTSRTYSVCSPASCTALRAPPALTSRGVERILAAATRADRQVAVANSRSVPDLTRRHRALSGWRRARSRDGDSCRLLSLGPSGRVAGPQTGVGRRCLPGARTSAGRPSALAGRISVTGAGDGAYGSRTRGRRGRGQHVRSARMRAVARAFPLTCPGPM